MTPIDTLFSDADYDPECTELEAERRVAEYYRTLYIEQKRVLEALHYRLLDRDVLQSQVIVSKN
jgi:hypothetical protein